MQQSRPFHLLSYAFQYFQSSSMEEFDDEFFAVILKYIASLYKYKDLQRNWQRMDSDESITMFFNLAKFLNDLPLKGENTNCAFALILSQITEWAEIPSNHNRQDVRRTIEILNRKFTNTVLFLI